MAKPNDDLDKRVAELGVAAAQHRELCAQPPEECGLLDLLDALLPDLIADRERLKGAMAADAERLRAAAKSVDCDVMGSDAAHWMADEILGLRKEAEELRRFAPLGEAWLAQVAARKVLMTGCGGAGLAETTRLRSLASRAEDAVRAAGAALATQQKESE